VYEYGIGVPLMRSHAHRGERALEDRYVERVDPSLPARLDEELAHALEHRVRHVLLAAEPARLLHPDDVLEHLERRRVAQVMAKRVRVGDHQVDERRLERLDLGGRLGARIGVGLWLDEGEDLPREAARRVDERAPQLSSLPEPVVGGVVAKAEEDAERQADERERGGRQRVVKLRDLLVDDRHRNADRSDDDRPQPDVR